jgi:hypothetical protein
MKKLTREKRKAEPRQGKLVGAWTAARGSRAVLSSVEQRLGERKLTPGLGLGGRRLF